MNEPIRVLYLDDSRLDRELVRDALETEDGRFRITEATTRRQFQDRLAAGGHDLVLSDFHVPGFDGLEVIDAVRARDPGLPVVIVTGTGSEQTAVEAMKRGAADYVIKTPHHIQRLPGTILAALERERLRVERRRAEEAREFLAESTILLSSSLDFETTLSRVVHLVVPYFSQICVVHLLEDGAVRLVAMAHADPSREAALRELGLRNAIGPQGPHPVARALRTGESQRYPDTVYSPLTSTPADAERLVALRAIDLGAAMIVPLKVGERVLGAITFGSAEADRRYTQEELALVEDLARPVALALDNARLYRAAKAAISLRDEFLAVAAHELKTPVTSLKGFAQLVIRQLKRDGAVSPRLMLRALEVIDQQSDKLTRLVGQLLDVSRIEAGRLAIDPRAVDVAGLVESVVEVERMRTGRDFQLVRPPAQVWASLDALRLEQVLVNLLDNAAKFSPGGSRIDVEVSLAEGCAVRVAVRDRGIGIPTEQATKVFDRFYQIEANRNSGGMGLGLHVSRHIVELHGGRIEVESPPDGGTRFVVVLPACSSGDRARVENPPSPGHDHGFPFEPAKPGYSGDALISLGGE